MSRGSARLVAVALVGAGLAYFAGEAGWIGASGAETALTALALAVLLHLALTVDPAWLFSAGIVATMFAGNWQHMGLNASIGPHRVILGAATLALLLRARPARDRPPLTLDGTHLAMAAALGFAGISAYAVGTIDDANPQAILLDQFGVLPFALFALAPLAFRTDRQRMILLGFLVGAGAYLSVTAVLERLKVHELVWPGYIADPGVGLHFGRARGPFVEAAAMGLALFGCTVAAAIALALWKRTWARAVAGGVVVLAPVGLLMTVTRGVWLAAIAGTLAAVATTAGLRRYLLPIVAGGIMAVVVAFALVPGLQGDAERRQNDQTPVYDRRNTNAAGLRMVADRPVVGYGWGKGNENMEQYFRLHPDIPLTGARAGLHNVYLYYATSLGLVGLGLWLVAVLLAFGQALASQPYSRGEPWRVGLKALAVAWLVIGLFSPALYPFATYLAWAWAGVVAGLPAGARAPLPGLLAGNGRGPRLPGQAPRGATT